MWDVIDYVGLGLGFVWLGWYWLRAKGMVWDGSLRTLPRPKLVRFWLLLVVGPLGAGLLLLVQHLATGAP
jgi:hypothetical protein